MKRLRWQIIIVFLALIAIGLLLYGQQPEILPEIEEVEIGKGKVLKIFRIQNFGIILRPGIKSHDSQSSVNRISYGSKCREHHKKLRSAEGGR